MLIQLRVENLRAPSHPTSTAPEWPGGSAGGFIYPSAVTSETDSKKGDNYYSLQVNSNTFKSPMCSGASDPSACRGWVQFIFGNNARNGSLLLQYWLIGYNATCPDGWATHGTDCFVNSSLTTVPWQPITNLGNLTLSGTAGIPTGGFGNFNMAELTVGSSDTYYATFVDNMGLGTHWTEVEYNVFGWSNGSIARFNDGASIGFLLGAQAWDANGNSATPACKNRSWTGEQDNLYLNDCVTFGSDAIYFSESR